MSENKVLEDARMLSEVWPGFERGYPAVIRVAQAYIDQRAALTKAEAEVERLTVVLTQRKHFSVAEQARAKKAEADSAALRERVAELEEIVAKAVSWREHVADSPGAPTPTTYDLEDAFWDAVEEFTARAALCEETTKSAWGKGGIAE